MNNSTPLHNRSRDLSRRTSSSADARGGIPNPPSPPDTLRTEVRAPGRCAGITRRSFLLDTGMGFTGLALSAILFRDGVARADSPASSWRPPDGKPHFPPRAKSVIWIFLCGGVSHVESFDIKPELNKYAGKSIEETPFKNVLATEGKDIVGGNPKHGNRKVIMPLQDGFKAYGQSGLVVGDWFAHIGACADDLAVVRSLWTIHNDHGAQLTWQTGRHPRELEHPTLGAWVSYGLGSVNETFRNTWCLACRRAIAAAAPSPMARPISVPSTAACGSVWTRRNRCRSSRRLAARSPPRSNWKT